MTNAYRTEYQVTDSGVTLRAKVDVYKRQHGDGEDADQCDGAADVAVEHPRASLAQLGVRLVNHRAKEDVGKACLLYTSPVAETANRSRGSGRSVRGAFAPDVYKRQRIDRSGGQGPACRHTPT